MAATRTRAMATRFGTRYGEAFMARLAAPKGRMTKLADRVIWTGDNFVAFRPSVCHQRQRRVGSVFRHRSVVHGHVPVAQHR